MAGVSTMSDAARAAAKTQAYRRKLAVAEGIRGAVRYASARKAKRDDRDGGRS